MNKKFIRMAIFIFIAVVAIITIMHSFVLGRGFHVNWSISRYMGTDFWSAIVFCLANFVVAVMTLKYLFTVKREYGLSPIFVILAVIMTALFISLSVFPVGLFDETWGNFGLVSHLHRGSSYTLFAFLILLTLDLMIEVRKGLVMHLFGAAAVALSLFCVVSFFAGWDFFNDYMYIFESGYVLMNLVFYSLIPRKNSPSLV